MFIALQKKPDMQDDRVQKCSLIAREQIPVYRRRVASAVSDQSGAVSAGTASGAAGLVLVLWSADIPYHCWAVQVDSLCVPAWFTITMSARGGVAVRLLAVLCATASGCTAAQQQQQQQYPPPPPPPAAAAAAAAAGAIVNRDQLSDLVAQAVRDELQPVISNLEAQIKELNKTLYPEVGHLLARVYHLERLTNTQPRDCSELPAGSTSGRYFLWPGLGPIQSPNPFYLNEGVCDMETDGGNWTVIQRRDITQPHEDFYVGWSAYKEGFASDVGEFWWGLKSVSMLTSAQDHEFELRIDIEDSDGDTKYAVYKGFRVSSEEDGYKLTISNYTGNAGNCLQASNNMSFSTRDRDQDGRSWGSCAEHHMGGWWYTGRDCGLSHLNGRHLEDGARSDYYTGIWWCDWRIRDLTKTEMKIRPIYSTEIY